MLKRAVNLGVVGVLAFVGTKSFGADADGELFAGQVRPIVQQYCVSCHNAEKHKGGLNLERFDSLTKVRKDVAPWENVLEMVQAGEMPPEGKKQPSDDERKKLTDWGHAFLGAEARAHAGDPGFVPLRRLTNAEYDNTIRDLTGIDMQPAREFPADGAAGEGFTNAAEALSDMSPTLLSKYMAAGKAIAARAVMLPDGFRFSASDNHRDWTNDTVAALQRFFARYTDDQGSLPLRPYLNATLHYRDALVGGQITLDAVAAKEKLSPKYLRILWETLNDKTPSPLLDSIRAQWKAASDKDGDKLAATITDWQHRLWAFVPIGSYRYGNVIRQVANDPAPVASVAAKLEFKPVNDDDVEFKLVAHELVPGGPGREVIWHRPRFEAPGKTPLYLWEYAKKYGPICEVNRSAVLGESAKYLAAVVEGRNDAKAPVEDVAKKDSLSAPLLKRWIALVALEPLPVRPEPAATPQPGTTQPATTPAAPAPVAPAPTPAPVVATKPKPVPAIPPKSLLQQWREAVCEPARQPEIAKLGEQIGTLLAGKAPAGDANPDRVLFESLRLIDSPIFNDLDVTGLPKLHPEIASYGVPLDRFAAPPAGGSVADASIVAPAESVVVIRVPASLVSQFQFVADATMKGDVGNSVEQFEVLSVPVAPQPGWNAKTPVVAAAQSPAFLQFAQQFADFRKCFPQVVCFPHVVPVDEVVDLKQFHREDELLKQLFLSEGEQRELDHLWVEQRYISRWPVTENEYLPLFIGFVTQDQPKELLNYFEGQRETFRKRAEAFLVAVDAAAPAQMQKLLTFTERAYRRPLSEREKSAFMALYANLRSRGMPSEDAVRGVLARVLMSPAFLFRVESAPPGEVAGPVSDDELATRLSYFLWSSMGDDELQRVAASGKLHDPDVLEQQTRRMMKDARIRELATEFGTQWIHVRDFNDFKEKNEQAFPTFNDKLRGAIYEESVLLFQDLFQQDEQVTSLIDGDFTYLNDTLAGHYGIPNVMGPEWRRVNDVKKYGRGGILGLASVLSKESGASRTSPILRGNWVVETLLGEKLPRPPADVPKIADEQAGADGLTVRQIIEKHTSVASCAVCHTRIDPFGFAMERFDAIGRFREKETNGALIECKTKLKDGTEFDGPEGLRAYLMTKKKDVIVRLFCKRLLGYAIGRAVTLSDQPLIDEMMSELNKHEGHVSAAVVAIVRSSQFRCIRGSDFATQVE